MSYFTIKSITINRTTKATQNNNNKTAQNCWDSNPWHLLSRQCSYHLSYQDSSARG